jgi:hypothetical protein
VTRNHASDLEPIASFVVEREAGRGYRVTAANGDCPEERRTRAVSLLDDLGQPDPKGPDEYFRWLGPIAPSGEYIVVSIRLMPNGEARYHQGWFRIPTRPNGPRFRVSALLMVAGLVAGTLAGRMLPLPDRPTRLDPGASASPQSPATRGPEPGSRSPGPASDPRLKRLNTELSSTRDVRAKVKDYLSQEGLAATSMPVSDLKRSVKLIADLDRTPPPQESVRLDNVEVAKLLEILRTLDDLHEQASSTRGISDQ